MLLRSPPISNTIRCCAIKKWHVRKMTGMKDLGLRLRRTQWLKKRETGELGEDKAGQSKCQKYCTTGSDEEKQR